MGRRCCRAIATCTASSKAAMCTRKASTPMQRCAIQHVTQRLASEPVFAALQEYKAELDKRRQKWSNYLVLHTTIERNAETKKLLRRGIPPELRGQASSKALACNCAIHCVHGARWAGLANNDRQQAQAGAFSSNSLSRRKRRGSAVIYHLLATQCLHKAQTAAVKTQAILEIDKVSACAMLALCDARAMLTHVA